MEVQVQGEPALIKRYDDPKDKAYKVSDCFHIRAAVVLNPFQQWLSDVKMLQNL